jgi:hypothetical protein
MVYKEDILKKYLYNQVFENIKNKFPAGSLNRDSLETFIEEKFKDKIFTEFYDKLFEENINSDELFDLKKYKIFKEIENTINKWPII